MSLEKIKQALADKQLRCPSCGEAILKYDKYIDSIDSIWDGAGDSVIKYGGGKVTLICGNGACDWKERTEYWQNYLAE